MYYTPGQERQLGAMSKGTQVYSVRINPFLVELARETIERRNNFCGGVPWTFSDFITIAMREKLAKMKRSRCRGKRRSFPPPLEDSDSFA